jgi:hypothetical protein
MALTTREWYDAWAAKEPGPSGFLDGVGRAWQAVATGGEHIAEEAQCALVRGSVGSMLAQVTPELLQLLLEERIWTLQQAFAYVRAAPVGHHHHPEVNRGKLLNVLAPRVPDALLPQLFDVACGLEEIPFSRLDEDVFDDLLRRMALVDPTEARLALQQITSRPLRAFRMGDLARHLPADKRAPLLREALGVARQTEPPEHRANVLDRISAAMTSPDREQAQREALDAACAVADTKQRCYVLAHIAAGLPADMQARACAEALAAAKPLRGHDRLFALERLFEAFPWPGSDEVLRALEAEILTSEDLGASTQLCCRLLARRPEAEHERWIDMAFSRIERMPDESERARATTSLLRDDALPRQAEALAQHMTERALRLAQDLTRLRPCIDVLSALRPYLPADRCWRAAQPIWPALVEALRAEDSFDGHFMLHGIVDVAPIELALDAARQARFPWVRAELLTMLARRIPQEERSPILDEIMAALRSVVTPRKRAEILRWALPVAPPGRQHAVFGALVEAIDQINDDFLAIRALLNLADDLAEPYGMAALEAARDAAHHIDRPHVQFDLLLHIARRVERSRRDAVLDEALAAAGQETQPWLLRNHLITLAQASEGQRRSELLRAALETVSAIGDEARRISAMMAYAAHLPPEEMNLLAEDIEQIPASQEKAYAYQRFFSCCPTKRARYFEQALAAARKANPEPAFHRTHACFLAELAGVAPPDAMQPLLREVLDRVRFELASAERLPPAALLEDEYARSFSAESGTGRALATVAPYLPIAWVPEALVLAADIDDPMQRAQATVLLASRLEEAERLPYAEALLAAEVPRVRHHDPAAIRNHIVRSAALLLPEPRRSEMLARFVAPAQEELDVHPTLPTLPEEVLLERIDALLASDKADIPQRLPWLLANLPQERRDHVVARLLDRSRKLDPMKQDQILALLLPYVPAPWIDRGLDAVKNTGQAGLKALRASVSRLDVRQLDRALALAEGDRSSGSPHDERLEALAAISAEWLRRPRPPRARLQGLLHDTLHGRAETRAEALIVLSAMAPLIVGLGGTEAATGVVRAIRRAGTWWP